jgi:hypothetical protein
MTTLDTEGDNDNDAAPFTTDNDPADNSVAAATLSFAVEELRKSEGIDDATLPDGLSVTVPMPAFAMAKDVTPDNVANGRSNSVEDEEARVRVEVCD